MILQTFTENLGLHKMRTFWFSFGIFFLLCTQTISSEDLPGKDLQLKDVGVLILSQANSYHAGRAQQRFNNIKTQLKHLSENAWPPVLLSHEKWKSVGHWTLFPILKHMMWDFVKSAWLFICEEETKVNLVRLLQVLKKFDHKQHYFLGKALYDDHPVIQHHFSDDKSFAYPDFSAGFVISVTLLKELAMKWPLPRFNVDFTIDAKHEVANYIKLFNVKLTNVPELCTDKRTNDCVTSYPVNFPDCGPMIPDGDLYVAVKTCEKFHFDRLSIVRNTWAKDSENIEFISETEDRSIPTISLGVPNTDKGHCAKTIAILKRFQESSASEPWIVIADDDTIINLKLLRKLLSCYDPTEAVAMGERYGYSIAKGTGYNYITGGGGMVFSRKAVDRLLTSDRCACPADNSPDDMILGMCLRRLDIPVTHSPYFHQTRKQDYPEDFLSPKLHISFHKYWQSDPYITYKAITDIESKVDLVTTMKRKIRRDEL